MSLSKLRKIAKGEVGISRLFPITHLNSKTTFETYSGQQGCTMQIEGIPFVTEDASVLNQFNQQVHQASLALDERYIQYVTVHRKKENLSLPGEFSSTFANDVNIKYHARFKDRNLFRNNIYLTIINKGFSASKVERRVNWLERIINKTMGVDKNIARGKWLCP